MSRIRTAFTVLMDIPTPIVAAPMAGASGGALAAQASGAGAFGFIGAGYLTSSQIQEELSLARAQLLLSDADPLPIGVGYLAWQLDKDPAAVGLLDISLLNRVQAIWLAFGNNIGRWVDYIRSYDASSGRGQKTLIFVQVSSVKEALIAIQDWKVDVLVAQGSESGGHGYSAAPPLLTLVPSILAVLPKEGPPLLAAGGLSTGGHVASLLTLGVSGAVLGTRFLMTEESFYNEVQKNILVKASANDTVRTTAFDNARGTLEWPEGVDGRAIYNKTVKDVDAGVDIEIVRDNFKRATQEGDPDRILVWAGTGVDLVTEIQTAQDVVRELHADMMKHLSFASTLIAT